MSTVKPDEDRLFALYVSALTKEYPLPAIALAKQQLKTFNEHIKEEQKK